ncbi:FAD-dependent oxidoreductase [Streptomyces sp. SBR177]
MISGASLAGSAAAVLLARHGARVALLERRSDPEAYKVLCTHSITANARPVLDELGLVPALEKAGALPNDARWYTRWGWIEPRAAAGGPALPYGYNVRRSTLDPMLRARAAETPGVDLLLGHKVTGVVRDDGGRIAGVRVSAPDGTREIRARLVVGADGKDSAVAGFAGVPTRRHENTRFGYLAHFRDLRCAAASARPGSWNRTWPTRSPTTTGSPSSPSSPTRSACRPSARTWRAASSRSSAACPRPRPWTPPNASRRSSAPSTTR